MQGGLLGEISLRLTRFFGSTM
ncbi:hypothetical protein LINPERPRIM_LOCUS13017 [Linum perenne]